MSILHTHDPTSTHTPRLTTCVPSAMPEYMRSLAVLQHVLDFQEALAAKMTPRLHLDPEQAQRKWQAEQPLFVGEALAFPAPLFGKALRELRDLLAAEEPARETCDALLQSQWLDEKALPGLLQNLLRKKDALLKRLARELTVDAMVLGSVLRIVLSPYFACEAAPYQDWIATAGWRRGFCPICGSLPGMARLAMEDGRRILACCLSQ